MSLPCREYCIPHLSNAYQASLYDPHIAQKAVDGIEEGHQSNYPHQGALKANPDICPG